MTKIKYDRELMKKAQRAFAEAYAEDMDNWSALRQDQETWRDEEVVERQKAARHKTRNN